MVRPLIIDQGSFRQTGPDDTVEFGALTIDSITIDGAAITSATGAIGFDDENLTTTGIVYAGQLGVGSLTGTPAGLLHIAAETALINDQLYAWRFEHRSTGTPTAGFGVNWDFYLHDSANALKEACVQQVVWTDATAGSEDVAIIWHGAKAGSRVTLMKLDAAPASSLLTVYGDATFSTAGSRVVTIQRSGGTTLTLNASTTANGATIWTTTVSPLALGANNSVILTLNTCGVNALDRLNVVHGAVGNTLAVFAPTIDTAAHTSLAIKSVDAGGYYEPVLETPVALRITSTFGGAAATFRLLPSGNDIYFQNTVAAGQIYLCGLNAGAVAGIQAIAAAFTLTSPAGNSTYDARFKCADANTQLRLLGLASKNHIQSGNYAFNANQPLKIGGYNNTQGSTLELDFATVAISGDVTFPDNEAIVLGTGQDARIYYDGIGNKVVMTGWSPILCLYNDHYTTGGVSQLRFLGDEGGATLRGAAIEYFDHPTSYLNKRGRGLITVLGSDGMGFDWGRAISTKRDLSTDWADYDVWMSLVAGTLSVKEGIALLDNKALTLGTGADARIYYDGTDLVLDPDVVGSGVVRVAGGMSVAGTLSGNVVVDGVGFHLDDNRRFSFGDSNDATMFFDGAKFIINPLVSGGGTLEVRGTITSTATILFALADSRKIVFGTGNDAEIYYNGTDLVIDPDVVGTGKVNIYGALRASSFVSDDGSAGWSGTVDVARVGGGTRRLTFKNGLFTGYSDY